MAKRRGRGEGSIRERTDGRWEVRIDLGRGLEGKRRTKSAFAPTQAEAVKTLKRLNGRAIDGQILATSTPTVKAFLADWMATNSDTWKPSTVRSYRSSIDLYLVPAFGTRRIEQLTPAAVQRWLTDHKTEHGALFSVVLASGLRLGEATGVRWADANLETGELRVRQQLQRVGQQLVLQPLKTEKSRRTLMLPAVCLEQLRKHRQRQLQERLKAGGDWCDTGLVFTTHTRRGPGERVGAPLHPRNVLRMLHLLLAAPACRGAGSTIFGIRPRHS